MYLTSLVECHALVQALPHEGMNEAVVGVILGDAHQLDDILVL